MQKHSRTVIDVGCVSFFHAGKTETEFLQAGGKWFFRAYNSYAKGRLLLYFLTNFYCYAIMNEVNVLEYIH